MRRTNFIDHIYIFFLKRWINHFKLKEGIYIYISLRYKSYCKIKTTIENKALILQDYKTSFHIIYGSFGVAIDIKHAFHNAKLIGYSTEYQHYFFLDIYKSHLISR